jgi:predicted Zn-dependent protease with MMP-like domain
VTSAPSEPPRRTARRRRDRHGRGLRGPLAPAGLPLALSRAERFDELVLTALTRLERRWGNQLDAIEVVVEDVPDPDAPDGPGGAAVPLGRSEPATLDDPARIVVYRRAVEARARGQRARETLVHEVVVERLAELLGLDPEAVDPDAGE